MANKYTIETQIDQANAKAKPTRQEIAEARAWIAEQEKAYPGTMKDLFDEWKRHYGEIETAHDQQKAAIHADTRERVKDAKKGKSGPETAKEPAPKGPNDPPTPENLAQMRKEVEEVLKTFDAEKAIDTVNSILKAVPERFHTTVMSVVGIQILADLESNGVILAYDKDGVKVASVNHMFAEQARAKMQGMLDKLMKTPNSPFPRILQQGLLAREPAFHEYAKKAKDQGKPANVDDFKKELAAKADKSDSEKALLAALGSPVFTDPKTKIDPQAVAEQRAAIQTVVGQAGGMVGTVAWEIGALAGTGAKGAVGIVWELLGGAAKEGGGLGILAVVAMLIYSLFKFGPLKVFGGLFAAGLATTPWAAEKFEKGIARITGQFEKFWTSPDPKKPDEKSEGADEKKDGLSEFQKAANARVENDDRVKKFFSEPKRANNPKEKKVADYLAVANSPAVQALPLTSPFFSLDPKVPESVFSNTPNLPGEIKLPEGVTPLTFKRVMRAYLGVPSFLEMGSAEFAKHADVEAFKKADTAAKAANAATLTGYLSKKTA